MKIRYYPKIDGWRWLGFVLRFAGAFILSGGDPNSPNGWVGQSLVSVVVFGFTWD